MSRISSVILVLLLLIAVGDCLRPYKCQTPPKEKHCLIEYRVRHRWPHQTRYVYNWYSKSCFEIRWSDNCPPVAVPSENNNFSTVEECMDQCGGWS